MSRRRSIKTVARNLRGNLFGVGDLTDAAKEQWDNAIAAFQSRRAELDTAQNALWEVQAAAWQNEDDKAAWQSAMNKLYYAAQAMDAAASGATGISDTWTTVKSWFGLSGMNGLGIAVAIPFATLAALTGAAIIAINTCYAFISYINTKTDTMARLVAAGVDPVEASKQATAEAAQSTGVAITSNIAKTAGYLALAAAAFIIIPRVFK